MCMRLIKNHVFQVKSAVYLLPLLYPKILFYNIKKTKQTLSRIYLNKQKIAVIA